jgi:hypothetical protein
MKKFGHILALVAVMVAVAGTSYADSFQWKALPRLKFLKGGPTQTDSTSTSIVGMTTSTAVATAQDTTEWVNISGLKFAGGITSTGSSGTAAPLLLLQISNTVAADSVGYYVQFASDASDMAKFTERSVAYAVGALGNHVVAIDSDDIVGRFMRVILWGNDTGGVVHTYTITPVVKVAE